MARIRSVKPDFWDDEAIGEISRDARLLFIGLITQADDEGRLKGSPKLLKGKLLAYDDVTIPEVSGWLAELAETGLVELYSVKGRPFISLPSWHKHQRISHKTDSALPSPSEADSTDAPESFRKDPEDVYREGIGEEGRGEERSQKIVPTFDAPLSEILADLIEANGANRPNITQKWADAERLMLDRDHREHSEAERLIRWCQASEFWRANILSMPKFREKYDQLLLQAKARPKSSSPGMDNAKRRAEVIAARQAERNAA